MPLYQTSKDRGNETSALDKLIANMGIGSYEQVEDITAPVDAYLISEPGDRVALVEIKTRTNHMRDYGTLIIDKSKVDSLIAEAQSQAMVPVLLVQWADKTAMLDVAAYAPEAEVAKGGRYDRNDPNDIDDVYHFDIDLFEVIDG